MAAVAELWETLKEAIVAYTGLSPAAFFTAVAVAAALYHVVSGLFAPPPPPPPRPREEPEAEPLPPPVQMGEVSEEELRQYDGSDPKKPLLMAIKGQIYDVTQSRSVPRTKTLTPHLSVSMRPSVLRFCSYPILPWRSRCMIVDRLDRRQGTVGRSAAHYLLLYDW